VSSFELGESDSKRCERFVDLVFLQRERSVEHEPRIGGMNGLLASQPIRRASSHVARTAKRAGRFLPATPQRGANSAVPIWMEIMKTALKDTPAVDFPVPPGIEVAKIDPKSGKLAYDGQPDAIDEVFLEGTVPTEVSNPRDVLDTGSFMMEQLGGG
jgi:hypothetical protein